MTKTYPSAIDPWPAVLLVGAPLLCVVGGAFVLASDLAAGLILLATGLFVVGIIALVAFPCVYTLTPSTLTIRSGIVSEDIPLERIRQAEPNSSIWAAPALSLRRVRLTLDDGTRLISPRDRESFLSELNAALAHGRA